MPIKRGHVAPQNTYIVTLIRSFDSQCINFLAANAMFHTKPIIYCSDGLCELFGYTKGQLMLKSSTLKVLYGSETSAESIEALCLALEETKETEITMNLYSKEGSQHHLSPGSSHNSVTACDTGVVNQSARDRIRRNRPISLFLPDRTGRSNDSNRLLRAPNSGVRDSDDKANAVNTSNDAPSTKSRAATWYRTRTASEEDSSSVLLRPFNARGRSGAHINTAESEALRLVLSSHTEPTKSSVTEKFAQFLSMDEDLHVEHRFQSPRMHKFTLKHYSVFKAVWDWIILALIIYTAIATPYTAVFLIENGNKYAKLIAYRNNSQWDSYAGSNLSGFNGTSSRSLSSSSSALLSTVDILVDIMFFVDILINFRTTYVNKNDEVVSHPRRIATHYIKGWFFIDLVAAIPFDLIFFQSSGEQPTALTSVLKSARLLRLVGIVRKLDRYSEYGASILLLLTALFALIAHWLACIWYAIGHAEHLRREPKIGWLDTLAVQTEQFYTDDPQSGPNLPTPRSDSAMSVRIRMRKKCSPLLSCLSDEEVNYAYIDLNISDGMGGFITHFIAAGPIGENERASQPSDRGYPYPVIGVNVVVNVDPVDHTALMYASIFGNVGALIQRLYSGTARYHAQMLRIKEFIRFHQIPSPLKQRLEEYSTQVWEHTNGIDMTMVQYSFPESLQSDICLYVYRDFLGGSSAFKCESEHVCVTGRIALGN
ncbi:unnamed protein product [Echinostoma caproni]|uniref:Ion_trans domain-containing protein n=1 Tax=Echinostoma caproni TaxID=27848 RepID=A0A183ANQ4_9TREM|nr:unnamed protein product [Echinostoma caproni]